MTGEGPLILVAEDELLVAQVLCDQLEAVGYAVLGPAANAPEALALAGERRPDLMILDVGLRGPLDGIDLARALRERTDAPVLFLTGYANPAVACRVAEIPGATLLTKPILMEKLHAAVREALARR